MKKAISISAASLALFLLVIAPLHAQTGDTIQRDTPVVRRSPQGKQPNDSEETSLSIRARAFNDLVTQRANEAPWIRIIYRRLDLTQDSNAPLYYPLQAREGMQSLFGILFDLLNKKKLPVYEYLDGFEVFDKAHEVQFKDFLDRFHIMYTPAAASSGKLFEVNTADIPNSGVKAYYVKEMYYFDPQNSNYTRKILAICPILSEEGDIGAVNMPLFWVPYETLRPYISDRMIMISNMNNARIATYDDFFRLGMYQGEIVMTNNLQDRSIAQYCPTPDSVKMEQNRIENELKQFENHLYATQDTSYLKTQLNEEGSSKVTHRRSTRSSARSKAGESKVKTAKIRRSKAPKAAKSGGSSTRSVRSVRNRG